MFAASAAVGVSSAFNAPVGGLLFSIELTSTYYLVTNYGKSFVAATAGAFAARVFLLTEQNYGGSQRSTTFIEMSVLPRDIASFQKWEYLIFGLIGILFSWVAIAILFFNQYTHLVMKPYKTNHPILTVVAAAGITAIVIYFTGAYTSNSLRVFSLASDVLTDGYIAEMRGFEFIPPLVGLLISFFSRTVISIVGCNLPLPGGYFAPIFLMGTILGRFVGILVLYAGHKSAYLPGYALVGGCALASGVTQRISIAVIAVELTGNFKMLLPCLIASVISASMTKPHSMSVYDCSMKNKGLSSFQLLLRESLHDFRNASDVMSLGSDMAYIPQNCSALYLFQLLDSNLDTEFPVVEDIESLKLLGTFGRSDVFEYLWLIFHEWNMDDLLVILLPADSLDYTKRLAHMKVQNGIQKVRKKVDSVLSMRNLPSSRLMRNLPSSRWNEVSMSTIDEDVHCPEEKEKISENNDIEESSKAGIRLLLRNNDDVENKYNEDNAIAEIDTVLKEFSASNITPEDLLESDLLERLDTIDPHDSREDKGTTLSSEIKESIRPSLVTLQRVDSLYCMDMNADTDINNGEKSFRRSVAMVKQVSQFLNQLPQTPSHLKAGIILSKKANSIEDELKAFKLRPITRRRMGCIDSSKENSFLGAPVLDDGDPVKYGDRIIFAIKKVVKQRLKKETSNPVFVAPLINSPYIGTERPKENSHDDYEATIAPRAISYINDTDIKKAFRDQLDMVKDILNCPRFPRMSAIPYRYRIL
jgi:hypothetical protein